MNITQEQRMTIMILWNKVCKDRKWKSSDKAFRLAKFSELVGREIRSTNDIERLDECTKLMSELKCMLGISVRAGMEATDPTLNQARVLRNQILTQIIPCLELYRGDKITADIANIMEDKNRWWKIDRPACGMTFMDLDAKPIFRRDRTTGKQKFCGSQLSQMQWTLSRWLNDLRNKAGDTVHDMKIKAGVPCECAICVANFVRQEITAGEAENPIEGDSTDAFFEQESLKEAEAFGDGESPF